MVDIVRGLQQLAVQNSFFRQVIRTGKHSQVVLMALLPHEEIGQEVHELEDQFFYIVEGSAEILIGTEKETIHAGDAVLVPAGEVHNVTALETSVKIITIYSPAHHPDGTVHRTKAEASWHESKSVGQ